LANWERNRGAVLLQEHLTVSQPLFYSILMRPDPTKETTRRLKRLT
jgi:hypothetical protein